MIKTSTITKQAQKTSTITAPTATSIATDLTTSTIISTVLPNNAPTVYVTSTITVSSTATIAPTEIVPTTLIITVSQPTATVYAACIANNVVDSVNGAGIDTIEVRRPLDQSGIRASSALDCCISCQTTAGCYGYFYYNACTILSNGNCQPGTSVHTVHCELHLT